MVKSFDVILDLVLDDFGIDSRFKVILRSREDCLMVEIERDFLVTDNKFAESKLEKNVASLKGNKTDCFGLDDIFSILFFIRGLGFGVWGLGFGVWGLK
jgi:hypothetical protein